MEKKKKSRKKKLLSLKSLHKKCWAIVSEYIRRRDKGTCVTCGKREWNLDLGEPNWKAMQCGHYRHGRLEYDEMNLNCQCVRCNHHLSGNLGKYTLYLISKYGETAVVDLDLRADRETAGRYYSREELECLIEIYKEKLRKLS